MKRRELLEWVSRGLASSVAAVVGLPGIRFFAGSVQSDPTGDVGFVRVKRLKDLVPGLPTIVPVMGQKQDAWIKYDQQVIGRAWLVREPGDRDVAASGPGEVRALSSVCTHMGCQLQSQSGAKGFHCPCHRATFGIDGHRMADPRTGEQSHAPRDLDGLECRLVQDKATADWWVEVKYEKFQTGLGHRVATT